MTSKVPLSAVLRLVVVVAVAVVAVELQSVGSLMVREQEWPVVRFDVNIWVLKNRWPQNIGLTLKISAVLL